MKPYQKPPMEAQVLPATEMMGRPQRPPIPGSRGPPPHYKSRPGSGLFAPGGGPGGVYPVPAPRSGPSVVSSVPSYTVGGSKMAKPMARYHPSLSGSETDVSTSTENLTQVSPCF